VANKDFKISVGLVKIVQSYAASRGVEFNNIAEFHGFDPESLENGEARIQAKMFEALWLDISSLSNDPYAGLNFGKQAVEHFPVSSILFLMMSNCPTIARSLDVFVRYHRIMADNIQPQYVRDETYTHLSWDLSIFNYPSKSHLSEAFLCTSYSILGKLSKGNIRPVAVNFSHQGPYRMDHHREYENFFEAPVKFLADKDELVIDNRDLDIKIELADTSLFALLERHAKRLLKAIPSENEWSCQVAQLISKEIISGSVPVIDTIARDLAVSKRSLQEKLKSEGTCFRNLIQTVRKQTAVDQLSDPDVSICDVSFMLGYSDQSAFNHAFKRWTGKSPKSFTADE
jgi:AraC-like DNA-binding protein